MKQVRLTINGAEHLVPEGTTLGVVLASLDPALRRSPRRRQPRGLFCGMGSCFECAVRIDGQDDVRACLTVVSDDMTVETTS